MSVDENTYSQDFHDESSQSFITPSKDKSN